MKHVSTIQCPVCLTDQEVELVSKIDAKVDTDLKEALLAGQLFNFECDHCGAKRQLDSDCLYLDHDKQFIVSLIPNLEERKEQMEAILTQFIRQSEEDLSQYQMRVVRNAPTFVEKVTVLDQGLNDIVVEIVKLLTDGLFAKERPDDLVKNRYFYMHNGQRKLLYLTESDQLIVDFHQSLVDFAEDKYKKAIQEDTNGRFIVIDHNWAANLLEKKPGEASQEFIEQEAPKPLSKEDQRRIQKKLKHKK